MTNLNYYLEAAKADEIAEDLESQGYQVFRDVPPYSLIAAKNGTKIAINVWSYEDAGRTPVSLAELSKQAEREGYQSFRVVMVSPPRERTIQVEGLKESLFHHIVTHYDPILQELAQKVEPTTLKGIDISSIEVTPQGINVKGRAGLEVDLIYGDEKRNISLDLTLPIQFDVVMDHNMHIVEDKGIEIDTDV